MEISRRSGFIRTVLAASTAILLVTSIASARAQGSGPNPASTAAYDLPAQSLTSALAAVAQRNGLKLAYDASLSAGHSAPALRGS